MNILASSSAHTMTLKEITDLLEVRHNEALRVVENMAASPEFGELRKIRSSYRNNIGAELPLDTYLLDKRQSIAVASRLNVGLLMRIIDRWHELEAQANPAPAVPVTLLIDIPTADELSAAAAVFARARNAEQAIKGEIARLAGQLEALRVVASSGPAERGTAEPLDLVGYSGELDLFGELIPEGIKLVSAPDLSGLAGIRYDHMMAQLERRGVFDSSKRLPLPSGRGRKVLSKAGRKIAVQFKSGIIKWKPREALGFLGRSLPADRLH